jgi:hypothetical protein
MAEWVNSWRWEVSFTSQPLYPLGRAFGTHCTGGWVDPRAGLDDMEKWKFLTLPWLGRPDRSQSLYRLLFERYSVPIPADTPAILMENYRGFRQSPPSKCRDVRRLCHNRFLPNPPQPFIIHLSSYHPTLCILDPARVVKYQTKHKKVGGGNFRTNSMTISFSRRIRLHEDGQRYLVYLPMNLWILVKSNPEGNSQRVHK